jgi:SAM-dependent methyltransferase
MGQGGVPSWALLEQQAAWLAPARTRLLRRAGIARRRSILDLGCGRGAVTAELVRRGGGRVVALDCNPEAFDGSAPRFAGATAICASAEQLPLADGAFDLVFCQFALLWLDVPAAVGEIRRVLAPGGALAALEPDYGGMIEYPPEIATRDLWLAGLGRAGADPCVGRKLPGILAAAGFAVHVDLLGRLLPPSRVRFDLLGGLPLSDEENARRRQAEQADAGLDDSLRVVHLPMFSILAEIPA